MKRRTAGTTRLRAAYTEHIRQLATVLGPIPGNAFAEELARLEAGLPVVVPGWALEGYPHGESFRLYADGRMEQV